MTLQERLISKWKKNNKGKEREKERQIERVREREVHKLQTYRDGKEKERAHQRKKLDVLGER